jgi:hypothetical protein
MKIQASAKNIKSCVMCNEDIQRSELRIADGGMHRHLTCPEKKLKLTFINRLLLKIAN